ncbi:fimbria/pilus outer membrane usher protein [Qipengyuania sp. JC766]|uniref:fimbria/pilus outer membrane usher protein n=1 Tax=Qipengyuania sp. JC766 TaxID=3232139 RepID=UPI00345ADF96
MKPLLLLSVAHSALAGPLPASADTIETQRPPFQYVVPHPTRTGGSGKIPYEGQIKDSCAAGPPEPHSSLVDLEISDVFWSPISRSEAACPNLLVDLSDRLSHGTGPGAPAFESFPADPSQVLRKDLHRGQLINTHSEATQPASTSGQRLSGSQLEDDKYPAVTSSVPFFPSRGFDLPPIFDFTDGTKLLGDPNRNPSSIVDGEEKHIQFFRSRHSFAGADLRKRFPANIVDARTASHEIGNVKARYYARNSSQLEQQQTLQENLDGPEMDAPDIDSRAFTLSLPLIVNGRPFLPITATITTERVLAVDATDIVRSLTDVVDDRTLEALVSLGDRSVAVEELSDFGISIALNPATLALEIEIDPGVLRNSTIRASQEIEFSGVQQILPSDFSFGLTGALLASAPLEGGFDPRTSIGFSGFLNFGGIDGLNVDYGGDIAISNSGERSLFQRNRITAFKDWPEKALRISGGDLAPPQARLAGSLDLLGFSLERNYEALQPIRNIRPTASRSLRLDRRSIVEVYVNEVLVERFFAEAGPLDITQIPLASFSNNVTIIVEDSLGRREVDNFVFGSDISLLAKGIDQFSVSLGVLRNTNSFGFDYSDDPVVSAFYERGIRTNLTVAAHAVITERQQNAGGAAAIGTPFGTVTADFALSNDDSDGGGFAFGATYRGSPFAGADDAEFATLTVDYRSREFTTIGQFANLENIKFDLRADYQINLSPSTAAFASANYVERYRVEGADNFYSLGMRRNFGQLFTTLAARYSDRAGTDGGEFGILATVTLPFGRRNSVTATYDTVTGRGRAEFRRQRGLELPEVDYRVGIATDPGGESLFGGIGYANSRFDADLDLATRFGSGNFGGQTIANARFQTGIGFADGKFAIGRDASRGFTILSRHPSIEDATLIARTSAAGRELGIANAFGPGLFAVNSPFRPQQVAVEANDLPVGYDIGAGRYLLESGARSGLVIEIGNDAYRTVLATLLFESEPVSLEYGSYRRVDNEGAADVTFFTNRAGRAAFSDLAPGEYVIEFPDRQIAGRFIVAEDADALIRIEALEMERQ